MVLHSFAAKLLRSPVWLESTEVKDTRLPHKFSVHEIPVKGSSSQIENLFVAG
jgi:hypothetical protein